MENKKHKLYKLLNGSKIYLYLIRVFNQESFEIHVSKQLKKDFLSMHKIHLANNILIGVKVDGLEDTFENVKKSDIETILVNTLSNGKVFIAVYTDIKYSVIFGVTSNSV